MTLTNFKSSLKIAGLVIFLFVYTLSVFLMGKHSQKSQQTEKTNGGTSAKLDSPVAQDSPIQSAQVLASYVKLCSNTNLGFEIAYPKDWFTSYNDSKDQCKYFAPYSFVVPQTVDKEIAPISIQIVKPQDWENTVKFYQNPNDLFNVNSSKNIQVNGRVAIKVNSTSTGTGDLQKGYTRLAYLIFDSKTPIIVSYSQLDDKDDTQNNEKILEDMVSSLKLF